MSQPQQIMPLPYVAEVGESLSDNGDCWVIDCEQGSIAEMQCAADVQEATAKFLVRAANAHDALVEAVESRAVDAAVKAGLGVSEWRAFLTAKESAALELAHKE